MKKSLKLAVAAAAFATPAMAASETRTVITPSHNMENPLYLPAKQKFYSKLSNGIMLKVADSSDAHRAKKHDGDVEFPIIRIQEEMGYGITDDWAVHFSVQYTHDDDISRTGLSAGRIGTTYRILNLYRGFVWDVYGDLHLGGVGEMRGQYNIDGDAKAATAVLPSGDTTKIGLAALQGATGIMDYDNYSNGMWGFHFGTKFGYMWNDKLTTSAFVEVLRTIGDDNNTIRVVGTNTPLLPANAPFMSTAAVLASIGAPSVISAELKSTTEINAGVNAFYQWTPRWSTGAWFRYNQHASQGVKKITTEMPNATAKMVAKQLEARLADMQDGFDEYIVGLSVAHQFTEHAQVALYGEYTFDSAEKKSQNGTDVKAEMGVRVNFTF